MNWNLLSSDPDTLCQDSGYVVRADIEGVLEPQRFGPFAYRDTAEACLVALSGRTDVTRAQIFLLKDELNK